MYTKVQSSFMIDLNQVSLALRNSTARSLILLDEFGKGTAAAGSYISEFNTKTCLLKKTDALLLTHRSCPCLVLNRRCKPLCWSLEAPTRPRRRLLKGNSHDPLSRAILHWRARSSRTAHHFHPHGNHVRYAHRRDHRRRLNYYDNQGRKHHISLQVADYAIC
jgi:hypothetical protein